MTAPLRIGILGAARIAGEGIVDPAKTLGHELVAVAARDRARAEAFAAERGIATVHDSYAGVIADPGVDLVYNALVNSLHARSAPPQGDPRWSPELAGGATMDLGCYVLDAARQHERVLLIPQTIQRITERTRPGFDTPPLAGAPVLPPGRAEEDQGPAQGDPPMSGAAARRHAGPHGPLPAAPPPGGGPDRRRR